MKLRHGDLVFDLPEGWTDASSLMFLSPPDSKLADELRQAVARGGIPMQLPIQPKLSANITFSARPYPFSTPGNEFCEKELKALLGSVPSGRASTFAWGKLGPFEAATAELELSAEGVSVKQLHALAVGLGRVFHFCATSPLGDYERVKADIVQTLASIQVD
jgi:hypothetical protein